jgi:glucose-6-phosphate dehydrogenase assembly protein OpcA
MTPTPTPEAILRELNELWASLAKSESQDSVLRACTMTLILAADEEEEAGTLGELIAQLMHEHPSRAIVLRVQDGEQPLLESRVFAECWMPFGHGQQICCEQIEIRTTEGSLRDVPRLVSGLMAPDLPVVLVCRSASLFSMPAFAALLPVAGRVIVDSRRAADPAAMLRRIGELRASGLQVHDLAWAALTGWRYRIATAFDEHSTLARLPGVETITVKGSSPKSWYLAAWLESGVGKQVRLQFEPGTGIDEASLTGHDLDLRFARSSTCTELPDSELLRQELAIDRNDSVFATVLPNAIRLSGE